MKSNFLNRYTIMGIVTIIVLLVSMIQMYGDARVINYSGIVRSCTQKIVKDELNGIETNDLIKYVDNTILYLKNTNDTLQLDFLSKSTFQNELHELNATWKNVKSSIYKYREDESYYNELYNLSEEHYSQADILVTTAAQSSRNKVISLITIYFISVIGFIIAIVISKTINKNKIDEISARDSLTGALTTRAFEKEVENIHEKNKYKKYVIVCLDIQKFKSVNINHGYGTGDTILCTIANALANNGILASHNIADEFFVLMSASEDVQTVLNNILLNALNDLSLDNPTFRYGVCPIDDKVSSINDAMERADIAHKLARKDLKSILWCDEKLSKYLDTEVFCENHLLQGLSNTEFQLYLQPQVDLKTDKVISAESLVRWKLSNEKMMFPDEFIPCFENKGLINLLDYYMLEQTCQYLDEKRKSGEKLYNISVNFSRVTLAENDFYRKIVDIVDKYDIPYKYIGIEVVETALNNMGKQTVKLLEMLIDVGFKIAMDDFGAGYSSLNVLSTLPVHVLKLDRQFLWSMDESEKMECIITSVVDMAHKIGLEVLCEGVETQEQVEFLKSIGCDYAQGYFYSRPVPAEKFKEI